MSKIMGDTGREQHTDMIFYRIGLDDYGSAQEPQLLAVFGEASDGLSLNGGVSFGQTFLSAVENFPRITPGTADEITKGLTALNQAIQSVKDGTAQPGDFPDHRSCWLSAAQNYRSQRRISCP